MAKKRKLHESKIKISDKISVVLDPGPIDKGHNDPLNIISESFKKAAEVEATIPGGVTAGVPPATKLRRDIIKDLMNRVSPHKPEADLPLPDMTDPAKREKYLEELMAKMDRLEKSAKELNKTFKVKNTFTAKTDQPGARMANLWSMIRDSQNGKPQRLLDELEAMCKILDLIEKDYANNDQGNGTLLAGMIRDMVCMFGLYAVGKDQGKLGKKVRRVLNRKPKKVAK